MSNPDGNPNMRKGGPSFNPGGRPAKTDALREAERLLAELAPAAVEKLRELMATADEKVQSTIALGIVKATIGELSRVAGPNGEPLGVEATTAELIAFLEHLRAK